MNFPMQTLFVLAVVAAMTAGCSSARNSSGGRLEEYVAFCAETGMIRGDWTPSNEFIQKMLVGSCLTTQEFKDDFKVIYADRGFLSFRAEEYAYTGGAHGNTRVTVGTIDRRTGKRLRLANVFGKDDMDALKSLLRQRVIEKLGGEYNLLDEVEPTENFCLMGDGWHFVYNEYEVACYAAGAVEVEIGLTDL